MFSKFGVNCPFKLLGGEYDTFTRVSWTRDHLPHYSSKVCLHSPNRLCFFDVLTSDRLDCLLGLSLLAGNNLRVLANRFE